MFGKILGKIKGDTEDDNQGLVAKISKMNLTEMRSYINNKIPDLPVDEDGLNEVLSKLVKLDDKTSKRYIEIDDMDSKKKKGFELILSILTNKKITITTIELVSEFLEMNRDIIEKYDQDLRQIYDSKFKDALALAVASIDAQIELKRKMDLLN